MKLALPLTVLAVGAVAAAEAPTMDAGVVQVVTLFITTVGGVLIAYLAYKTAQIGRVQVEIEKTQIKTTEKMTELEKNTNSITKQLQENAGEIGIAKGKDEGRAELKAEQAQVAKGKIEAQEEKK